MILTYCDIKSILTEVSKFFSKKNMNFRCFVDEVRNLKVTFGVIEEG